MVAVSSYVIVRGCVVICKTVLSEDVRHGKVTVTLDVVSLEAVILWMHNVVGGSVLNETADGCSFLLFLSRDSSEKAIEFSLEAYNEKISEE